MRISRPENFACCLCYILAFVICTWLNGCGTKQHESAETKTEGEAGVVRDDVLQSLQSSLVTDLLQFSDEALNKGLLNDVDRTNRYLKRGNKAAAAANLGIYLSDLSCLVAHGRRDEANRYFQACLALSESIGMKKQFSEAVQLNFNEIIAGDSTLKKSLGSEFKDATNTAEEEEFQKLHAAALTGYYIEELYLLASFIKSRHANQDSIFFATLGVFASQKDELGNLIAYFDHVQLKSAGISVYQELLALQEKYWAIDTDHFLSLQKTRPDLVLQDKSLQDVFASLSAIRQHIIDY